jgi:hypothetical protein
VKRDPGWNVPAARGRADDRPDVRAPSTAHERDPWPSHLGAIELIWHRLNRPHDLRRFAGSSVHWAECDARLAPTGEIVTSHSPGTKGDRPLGDWLDEVASMGRGAKIDLKEGGPVLDGVLATVGASPIDDRDLWFNCAAEVIGGRSGFEAMGAARPRARRSVPVDTLAGWLIAAPLQGLAVLREIRAWGIDRVSISVQTQMFQEVTHTLQQDGWRVNIWDVSTAIQLRDAVEARPASITADLGILQPRDAD